jgi:putative transposase
MFSIMASDKYRMDHHDSHSQPGHVHFLTFWCHRSLPLLNDEFACEVLVRAINAAREAERFHLWAYVFMPEHLHLLIHPTEEKYSIPAINNRIIAPVARDVINHWQRHAPEKLDQLRVSEGQRTVHRFWKWENRSDRMLTDKSFIEIVTDFIELNPVRRGLVIEPTRWKWSSARARAGMDDVVMAIDPMKNNQPAHEWAHLKH